MSLIKVLPEALANKIAAGEVVERPASVVKELVDNAIDSGANKITIIIKNAGKSLVQVVDNGCGMSENDALLSFERHATSKIFSFEDFENIRTMGFRGEALPSIAAIAQVELVTRTEDEPVANQIQIDGSKIRNVGKCSGELGTSISVKNIFFNVPARKNFLKTNATEFSHIITILKKFFLAHPEIHFTCFNENDKIYDLAIGSTEDRIIDLLGENYFSSMLPVDQSIGEVKLHGFTLKPELTRHSKGLQFLFINQRLVASKFLNHAIHKAYGNQLERGEFPGYCLYLDVDPKLIDINVHPTKMDVRFTNDKMIYNFFTSAIQHALNSDMETVPEKHKAMPDLGYSPIENPGPVEAEVVQEDVSKVHGRVSTKKKKHKFIANQAALELDFAPKNQVNDTRLQSKSDENKIDDDREEPSFWQVHNRYILTQIKSGFVIIDQHLAHDRILFEKVVNILNGDKNAHSQQLLFPQTIELSSEDLLTYTNIEPMLLKIGYSVKLFSGKTAVIDAIPSDVKVRNEVSSFLEILSNYRKHSHRQFSDFEKMSLAFSATNSIREGEKLSEKEMRALMDQLFATSSPYFSVLGKPIIITINLDELERKFKQA